MRWFTDRGKDATGLSPRQAARASPRRGGSHEPGLVSLGPGKQLRRSLREPTSPALQTFPVGLGATWLRVSDSHHAGTASPRPKPVPTGMCVRRWLFCSLRNCVLPPPARACSVSGLRPAFPGRGKWPSQHCWSWRPGPSVARPLPHPLTSSSGVKSCTQGLRCCWTPRSTSDRPPGIVTLHAPSRVATCLSVPKRWDIRNKVTLQGQTVRPTGRKWPRDLEMQRTPGPRRPTLP